MSQVVLELTDERIIVKNVMTRFTRDTLYVTDPPFIVILCEINCEPKLDLDLENVTLRVRTHRHLLCGFQSGNVQ